MSVDPSQRQGARIQALYSFSILAVAAVTVWLPMVVMDREESAWLRVTYATWKSSGQWFKNRPFTESSNTRAVVKLLPKLDFNRGSVYLVGSSLTDISIDALEQDRLSHQGVYNLCQQQQTFTQEYQFVRYLIEQRGLATPSTGANGLVIGLCFNDGKHRSTLAPELWSYPYLATGLFRYDYRSGLEPVPMSATETSCRLAWCRERAFWRWAWDAGWTPVHDRILGAPSEKGLDMRKTFEKDWIAGADAEFIALGELVDLLHEHHVPCRFIFLPEKTWTRGFAPTEHFHRTACDLLTAKGVTVYDYRDAVPDDRCFADSAHVNYAGTQILSPMVEKVVLDFQADLAKTPAPAR
jgi:hypothetical protein